MNRLENLPDLRDKADPPSAQPPLYPAIVTPADAAETMDRLRGLFAECEASARHYMARSRLVGLDFDIRCAYAGLAGRLASAAGGLAARIERAERQSPPAPGGLGGGGPGGG